MHSCTRTLTHLILLNSIRRRIACVTQLHHSSCSFLARAVTDFSLLLKNKSKLFTLAVLPDGLSKKCDFQNNVKGRPHTTGHGLRLDACNLRSYPPYISPATLALLYFRVPPKKERLIAGYHACNQFYATSTFV